MSNKYEVVIKLDGSNSEPSASAVENKSKSVVPPANKRIGAVLQGDIGKAVGAGIIAGVAINTAKNVVTYEVSRVGFRTGDDVLQAKLNHGIETATKLASIAGAAIVNPLAGAALVAGYGVNALMDYFARSEQLERDRISVDALRERAGESMHYNRSRGLR